MGGEQPAEVLIYLDTRWACGGVRVRDGIIVGGAPIFKKLFGQVLDDVVRKGKYIAIRLGD